MMDFFDLQTDPPPNFIHQFISAISVSIVVALKFRYFFLFGLFESKTNEIVSPQQEEIHGLHPFNNRR